MRQSSFCLLIAAIILSILPSGISAQVAVVASPQIPFISLLNNGQVNANGCVGTVINGTSTPLATYTDFTGNVQNTNPVILNTNGTAQIWVQAGQSYQFNVKSFGGINCATGSTVATIKGIAGGTSQSSSTVTFSSTPLFNVTSQNQLFLITLSGNAAALPLTFTGIQAPATITFQITQDNVGGHTWSWPANTGGGAPINLAANSTTQQSFMWNGTTALALDPALIANDPNFSTTKVTTSQVISQTGVSPAQTGFVRHNAGDVDCWRNTGNSADVCLGKNAADQVYIPMVIPNAGVTGTVNTTLTKLTGAPSTAVQTTTADVNGILGITVAGGGTSGNASIQTTGLALCAFDGATTAGDYVINSPTVNGNCHDAGASPSASTQVVGRVLSTNGGAGTYSIEMTPPGPLPCLISSKTGNYTLTAADCIIQANASGGAFVLSLPHSVSGVFWTIVRTDSTAGTALTIGMDSGTINNSATTIPLPTGSRFICHADGTNGWCTTSTGLIRNFTASGCTVATSTDANCTGTIVISPALPDANYIPQITVNNNAVGNPFFAVTVNGSLTSSSIPYNLTCTFNCGTVGTPTFYVHIEHQ